MENSVAAAPDHFDLYEATLNDLPEGVLWANAEGAIIYTNAAAASLLGQSKQELLNQPFYQFVADVSFKTWLQSLRDKTNSTPFETIDKSLIVYVLVSILVGGKRHICFLVNRPGQGGREPSEMLRIISEGTASVVGGDFFKSLAYHVIISTGIRYAIITECANIEKTRVRTLVYIERDQFLDNFEYNLTGTPCEIVMKGEDYFCTADLDTFFPKDEGVKSYFGVPIFLTNGEVIGHIAIFDTKPMAISNEKLNILKIFASRAGAEIERKAADEKLKIANAELKILLKESEERFRDLFEEAPIAYVHEGLDSKFIKANRAAQRILGVRPDEVPTIYGKTLAPDTPDAQRRMTEAFESVGRGTDTSGVVLELRRKDNGKPIWIQWWSNPDKSGSFTRTMFIDITERVLMEQEQAKLQAQNQYLQDEIKLSHNYDEIVSKSNVFRAVLKKVEQVAATDATVLILGESGTGKELLCRAIHSTSKRGNRPLVKINCAALPANLIESELFGHEKGAFTGAFAQKIGRFELADGGTLFLDEIGELPLELQPKLLRILQEGEFERVGSSKTMKIDVRIIAATNRDLQNSVNSKEFRSDLYYRLNVFPIYSPPLRERKEDIPLLVNHFCKKHETRLAKKITSVPKIVLDALIAYDWPGNVRELENIIERGLIVAKKNELEMGDWLPRFSAKDIVQPTSATSTVNSSKKSLEEVERQHIIDVLTKSNWKIRGEDGAAKILELNPTTLEARIKKLGIARKR
ncbi:MAG: sigma 54-interacting transcriptional regulator [Cyclobacteriaceae bacterium]